MSSLENELRFVDWATVTSRPLTEERLRKLFDSVEQAMSFDDYARVYYSVANSIYYGTSDADCQNNMEIDPKNNNYFE